MMSKTVEEFYSELNSMNFQDINNTLAEASRNLEKCTEPFTAQDIIKQQQETINRQKAEIERFEECASREMLYEKVKSEAIKEFAERFLKKVHDKHYLLSDRINSKDYGMFTVGIEQAVNETKEEMVGAESG